MNISVIVPNYNGEKLLKKNLPFVIKACEEEQLKSKNILELIVCDDCSSDNSLEFLKSLNSKNIKIKIMANEKNLGFAENVNNAVSKSEGDIIILLNSDIRPENEFIKPLINHFKDPLVFAAGCMDKSIEGENMVLRGRGIGTFKRGFFIHSRGEVDKSNTLWVSGGSGAFKKSLWKKLDGFTSIYKPFYWEDIDLSYRALKSGYKLIFEQKSIVIHEHETGSIKSENKIFRINKVSYKNQFIFIWKNFTDTKFLLSHLLWLPYNLIRFLLRGDFAFFLGFINALILLPEIIELKLKIKKEFIKKDEEIIKEFQN